MIYDWPAKLETFFSRFQPMRRKTKTIHDLHARIFSRYALPLCNYFVFWLDNCAAYVLRLVKVINLLLQLSIEKRS